jgi:hypothetical protein
MRHDLERRWLLGFYVLLAGLALASFAAALYATRWGANITVDSVIYIDSARHLMQGQGLTLTLPGGGQAPMTRFPPLFPVVLAGLGFLGLDPADGARWLNAFLGGVNVWLIGFAIHRFTRSKSLALWGALLALASVDLLSVHTSALSEPMYLTASLLALLWLDAYLAGCRTAWLVLAIVAGAAAAATRYVGVVLIVVGAVMLFVRARPPWRTRIPAAAVFTAGAGLPLVLWAVRNRLIAHTFAGRTVAFHPVTRQQLYSAMGTFSRWFVPFQVSPALAKLAALCGALFLIALVVWVVLRRVRGSAARPASASDRLPYVVTAYVVCYVAFLAFSISFFDAGTPLDSRILAPALGPGIIVAVCLLHAAAASTTGQRGTRIAGMVLCLLFVVPHAYMAAAWVTESHHLGQGYFSLAWRQSPLIARIRQLPDDVPLLSNAREAVFFQTGRPALSMPVSWTNSRRGFLAYFDLGHRRPDPPGEDDIGRGANLRLLENTADGALYAVE